MERYLRIGLNPLNMDYETFAERAAGTARLLGQAYDDPLILVDRPEGQPVVVDPGRNVCRYCGRGESEVSFGDKTHLVPEMLGNRNIVSDSECDDCNRRFSGYERELSHFLGAARVVALVEGKKKGGTRIRSFESQGTGSTIEVVEGEMILNLDFKADNVDIDHDAKRIGFDIVTKPYTPRSVWAALARIAVGMMPLAELGDYAWLNDMVGPEPNFKNELGAPTDLFEMMWYTVPGGGTLYKPIEVELYSRRVDHIEQEGFGSGRPFAKMLVVKFGRYVLQLFLPSDHDMHAMRKSTSFIRVGYPLPYPKERYETYGSVDMGRWPLGDLARIEGETRRAQLGYTGDAVWADGAAEVAEQLAKRGLTLADVGFDVDAGSPGHDGQHDARN